MSFSSSSTASAPSSPTATATHIPIYPKAQPAIPMRTNSAPLPPTTCSPASPYTLQSPSSRRLSWIERFTRTKPDYAVQRDYAWAAEMDSLLALVDADTRAETETKSCGPTYVLSTTASRAQEHSI